MDKTAIKAEISAQSKLVESIPIDQALVTEIDRHIKDIENQLNERLVHVPAKVIIQNFLPEINKRGTLVQAPVSKGTGSTGVPVPGGQPIPFSKRTIGLWTRGGLGHRFFDRANAASSFVRVIKRFVFFASVFLAFDVAYSYPPPYKKPQPH